MLLALVLRSLVAGAYLTALAFHGTFDAVATLAGLAIVAIWAAPLVRDTVRRRNSQLLKAAGPVPMN
jgi:hypothetical protein